MNGRADHIKENVEGFVVAGTVPFLKLHDAEAYCVQLEVHPSEGYVVHDPAKACALATALEPELKRLLRLISEQSEVTYAGISALANERDKLNKTGSLFDKAWAEGKQERIKEAIGETEGLAFVNRLIQKRLLELFLLTRLKG